MKLNKKKAKEYLKKRKIKIREIARRMGYFPRHLGRVLNGHEPATKQLTKLLVVSLKEIGHEKIAKIEKDLEEIETIMEEAKEE